VVTDELVDRALAIVAEGAANYHYFFGSLQSPDWISPLKRRERFSNPPPAEIRDDSIRFPPWPEGEYLLRMASKSPQEVFNAINEKWYQSDNHSIHDLILRIAAELPPALAAQMAKAEAMWASRQKRFYLLYSHRAEPLIIKLAQNNEVDAALKLLDPILSVQAPDGKRADKEIVLDGTAVRLSVDPVGREDPWNIQKLVAAVGSELAKSEPAGTLSMLSQKLSEAVEIHQNDRRSDDDFSTIWRPQIAAEDRGQLLDVFVAAVRDVGLSIVRNSETGYETVVKIFETQKWPIFKRLEYYVLSDTTTLSEVIVSRMLTKRDLYQSATANPEFKQFLSNWISKVPEETRQKVFEIVDSGPDLNRYSRYLGGQEARGLRSEAEQWITDKWHLEWLTVLEKAIDNSRCDVLTSLTEKYGRPQSARMIGGFRAISDASALSLDEMKELSIGSLMSYLRNWEPPPEWDPEKPNRAGLGGILQLWVKENPGWFTENLGCFEDDALHPTYLRSMIDAFSEVLKGDSDFDIYAVVRTIEWLLRNTTPTASDKSDWDEDPGWNWAHMSSARFLAELFLHPQRLDLSRHNELWPALNLIAENPSPLPEDENHLQEKSDFGIHALNSIRSVGIEAVMRYAGWIKESNSGITADSVELSDVFALLGKHLDPVTDGSIAVREMFGMHFNLLAWLDQEWLEKHLSKLFPKKFEVLDRFAWNSYLLFSRPVVRLLPAMRFRYERAINALQSNIGAVNDSERALGNHLINYYKWGVIEVNDTLLASYFSKASPSLRAQTIGDIGWQLRENQIGVLAPDTQARLMSLWQNRFAKASEGKFVEAQKELASFGWWLASGKFPDQWAIQQAVVVLDKFRKLDPDFAVVERLAELAPKYPFEAVHCLGIIFEEDRDGWAIHGWDTHPQSIIQAALRADGTSHAEAERVVNLFVSRGHTGLRSLLKLSP
jgi:hypothetical protein